MLAVISRDYVTASGPTRPSLSLTDRALAGHAAVSGCSLFKACMQWRRFISLRNLTGLKDYLDSWQTNETSKQCRGFKVNTY